MIYCLMDGCRFNDTKTGTCSKGDILIRDNRCVSCEGAYAAMEREKIVNAAYEVYGQPDTPPPPEVDRDTGEVINSQTGLVQETL
ncbi:MAG: hypothetical protein RR873_07800 [Christensenella sp.]